MSIATILSWLPSWSVTFGAGGLFLLGIGLLIYSAIPLVAYARLAVAGAVLALGASCYLAGVGSAQSVCEAGELRDRLAFVTLERDAGRTAAEDASRRASILDETLQANKDRIDDYETALAARPDARCALTGDDLRGVLGGP